MYEDTISGIMIPQYVIYTLYYSYSTYPGSQTRTFNLFVTYLGPSAACNLSVGETGNVILYHPNMFCLLNIALYVEEEEKTNKPKVNKIRSETATNPPNIHSLPKKIIAQSFSHRTKPNPLPSLARFGLCPNLLYFFLISVFLFFFLFYPFEQNKTKLMK